MNGKGNAGAPKITDALCVTFVLNGDGAPLMPCHPARARELVRKGKARWVRSDTIQLVHQIEKPGLQPVIVGQDMGDRFIGTSAVVFREKSHSRVVWREVAVPRPAEEITYNLAARRNYRRGRRSRKCGYRAPRVSPIRRVGLTARLYNRHMNLIRKLPLREARRLMRESPHEIKRLHGNKFMWLKGHLPPAPTPKKPDRRTNWYVYRDISGKGLVLRGVVPVEGDGNTVEKEAARIESGHEPETSLLRRLLGFSRRYRHGPLARLERIEGHPVLVLLSERAERFLIREAPAGVPPFRTLGQLRRPDGWLPPSARSLSDAHLRALERIASKLPVSKVVLETARFDVARLDEGRTDIRSDRWGQKALARQHRKDFVLARDGWKCVWCGKSGTGKGSIPLTVDHLQPRNPRAGKRGTDRTTNLVAACVGCNTKRGNMPLEAWLGKVPANRRAAAREYVRKLGERDRAFRAQARMSAAKSAALREARRITGQVSETRGYVTKRLRISMGLRKTHDFDAVAMAADGQAVCPVMPPLAQAKAKRYGGSANANGRRQRFKAQPVGRDKAQGKPGLYKQRKGHFFMVTETNRSISTPAGTVRKGDLVFTPRGAGLVKKILSRGAVVIGTGQPRGVSVPASRVLRVLRRRSGWICFARREQAIATGEGGTQPCAATPPG